MPDRGTHTELREPHFMQDESWLREQLDDDRERYLQRLEDATASPTYAPSGDSDTTGGTE